MRIVLGIIALFLLGSCHEVIRPEKPENLIPKDKMVQILAEAYIGNSARSISNKILRENGMQIDSLIYARFEVDSLQLAQSNAFYASDINGYIELMQQVETELKQRKVIIDSLYDVEKEAKKKKDSIKKAKLVNKAEVKIDTTRAQLLDPVEEQ